MKLNVVYGRSGTGKSEYIFNDINKKAFSKNVFLIVPEQYNLSAERKLFNFTQKKSLINVQVLTLSRMAYRVFNEVGGIKEKNLSKAGKNMIIYDLLLKNKKKLNFLGKSEKNIDIVNNLFTELKKHKVKTEDIKNINLEDKYTNLKLEDVDLLYTAYDEKMKNIYIDENDTLDLLAEKLEKSNMFKDAVIYIDEFLGFTPQEYKVFEALVEKASEITIGVCTDEIEIQTIKEKDIFYFNKKFINKLIELVSNKNGKIEKIKMNKEYRLKSKELLMLEENFYFSNKIYKDKTQNVKLFLSNNPYSEIENVAKTIHNLVKKCGLRYRDIAVITKKIELYSEETKVIFKKYGIPVFIDEKKDLNQNVLIKFIINLLDIFSKNWSYEAVFDYIKLGLLDIEEEDIFLLENYCRKWGIKGSKWYDKSFNYEPLNELQEKLENIRKKITQPLLDLKNDVSQNKTALEITKAIYKFIIDNKINVKLDDKIKYYNDITLSEEYNTSYKILVKILEDISEIFENEKMSFEKYKEILQVGLNSSDLGKIPMSQDVVILADTERSRSSDIKALFVVGLNDGIFPSNTNGEGFLNDKDREILKSGGVELAKNSIELLYEEQFEFYRTITLPEEKLFISYASSDKDGNALRPSILVKKLKRFFVNITEESDIIDYNYEITNKEATFEDALEKYKKFLEGETDISDEWKNILLYFYNNETEKFNKALSGINYSNIAEDLNYDNTEKLYGNTLRTSISKLEEYRRCAFSYYLKYGLKLKENDEFKVKSLDTGSFMHEVIDSFFEYLEVKNIDIKNIETEDIKKIVEELINTIFSSNRFYIFTSSKKYIVLSKKLKRVVLEAIEYIVYTLKNSDFKILGHEIEFDNKSKYKPIVLETDNGKKIEIIGKIDRVDVGKLDNKQYVRIIDYKSSIKNIDLNQVVAGLQIQLITYLDAISEQENFIESGILYMPLIENIVKSENNLTEEEIKEKIRKNFKMQGMILADISVVKMMDNKLESGYSDIIPAYINKDGNLSESNNTLKIEEFKLIQNKVKSVIKEIAKEILKGKIDIKPYNYKNKTGCDYCNFKSICRFNTSIKGNEYSYIKNVDKKLALELIKK